LGCGVIVGAALAVGRARSVPAVRTIRLSATIGAPVLAVVTVLLLAGESDDRRQAGAMDAWRMLEDVRGEVGRRVCAASVLHREYTAGVECTGPESLAAGFVERWTEQERMALRATLDVNFGQINSVQMLFDARENTTGLQAAWFFLDGVRAKRGQRLAGADFSYARMRSADLSGVDLQGADFRGADLAGIRLGGANLAGATLNGADLSGAELAGANLDCADLVGAKLDEAVLKEATLVEADLRNATLRGLEGGLSDVDLRKTMLRSARIVAVDLGDAVAEGADLANATVWAVDAARARLGGASLRRATLCGVDFRGAVLAGADLSEANAQDVDLTRAVLEAANLSGTELSADGAQGEHCRGGARGLTQAQLDGAVAEVGRGPGLAGVVDAQTGRALEWRGEVVAARRTPWTMPKRACGQWWGRSWP